MNKQKILVVEDQEKYRAAAKAGLSERNIDFAINYDEGISRVQNYDIILTDLFFQQNSNRNSPELQARTLDAIKKGLVKKYVNQMCEDVKKETGVEPDDRLKKCFATLGYFDSAYGADSNAEHMRQAISVWTKCVGNNSASRLEEMLRDMCIEKSVERTITDLFSPLKKYMAEDVANQPFGYLIAEEAERLGKGFVIATSLAHSQLTLEPVLKSSLARGWKLMEAKDGSKDNPDFWVKAYESARGGK